MKTDRLIKFLALDAEPLQPPRPMRAALAAISLGLLIAIALTAAALRMRPDIGAALAPVLLKAAFGAATVVVALPFVLRLARPGRPLGGRLLALLGGFIVIAAATTGIAFLQIDPEDRMNALTGGGFPWCLVAVPLLGAPTAAALASLVRGLAPTSLTSAGAAIGAAAGGVGAMAYAMHCPVDSAPFVITWYSAAIALCAAVGAVLGTRLLRW